MRKPVDAVDHLYDLFIRGDPESEARFEHGMKILRLIDQVRDLREKAGLTQSDLARKLGMKTKTIAELEDPDSEGQSVALLQEVISALGMEFEFKIVKKNEKKRRAKPAAIPA